MVRKLLTMRQNTPYVKTSCREKKRQWKQGFIGHTMGNKNKVERYTMKLCKNHAQKIRTKFWSVSVNTHKISILL